MIGRLATGLKKLPSEILTMTFPQVYQVFGYWKKAPPENEMLALLAKVYTTWRPVETSNDPPEVAHRKSLEERWKSGYMNVKQMFEGAGFSNFARHDPATGAKPTGLGNFPGMN